jgi:hypothetical protein
MTRRNSSLLLIVVLILAVASLFGYTRRYQLRAKLWHWRHGNHLSVGAYEVPVPSMWLVDSSNERYATLVNTSWSSFGPDELRSNATLMVSSLTSATPDLDGWSNTRISMLRPEASQKLVRYSLRTKDEKIECLGGHIVYKDLKLGILSLECRSEGSLSLIFSGPTSQLPELQSFIAEIHKIH